MWSNLSIFLHTRHRCSKKVMNSPPKLPPPPALPGNCICLMTLATGSSSCLGAACCQASAPPSGLCGRTECDTKPSPPLHHFTTQNITTTGRRSNFWCWCIIVLDSATRIYQLLNIQINVKSFLNNAIYVKYAVKFQLFF